MAFNLTQNQTVFEYADELDDYGNIPYHKGLIPIAEINLYLTWVNENVRTSINIIQAICDQLFNIIHNNHRYEWVTIQIPQLDGITALIIGRLRCVTNEYNEYDNFIRHLERTTQEADIRLDRRYVDDDVYQIKLSYYIIRTFINNIGALETARLFVKHYGDIVNYLFYPQ